MTQPPELSTRPVALVTTSLVGGGAERNWLNLAGGLIERGYTVDVIALALRGELRSAVPAGAQIYGSSRDRCDRQLLRYLCENDQHHEISVGHLRRLGAWFRYRRSWPSDIRLLCTSRLAGEAELVRAYIQARNPRALLATQTAADRAAIMAREAACSDAMVSVTVQNNVLRSYSPEDRRRAEFLYPKADAVIGLSRGLADDVATQIKLPPDRVRCIYNGISVSQVVKASFGLSQLGGDSFPYNVPVVVSAMRLTDRDGQKDHDTLLRAFAIVRMDVPSKLVLLGTSRPGNAARDRILTLASELGVGEDVVLWGFDENPYPYMRAASVLVQSSRWEGFANVIVEAMACGTPVVSTDAPFGPAELLDSGRFGPVVPIGDEHQMAVAIKDVLAGRRVPSDVLRKRAEDFSLSRMIDGYERLILGRRSPDCG